MTHEELIYWNLRDIEKCRFLLYGEKTDARMISEKRRGGQPFLDEWVCEVIIDGVVLHRCSTAIQDSDDIKLIEEQTILRLLNQIIQTGIHAAKNLIENKYIYEKY